MSAGNKKKHMVLKAAAMALLAAAVLSGRAVSHMKAVKTDTAQGLAYIKHAEAADIYAVRHKMKMLGEKDGGKSLPGRDYKVIFEDSVIMGDSVPEMLRQYGYLNASSVTAKAQTGLGDQIKMLKDLNPEIIFICYGTDDITAAKGNIDEFISRYAKVLDSLAEDLPKSKIFVNSVFPVRADTAAKRPQLEYLSLYNKKLQELCDKRNIAFIDNADLAEEEFYENDGIHFKAGFCPYWLERMQKVADL